MKNILFLGVGKMGLPMAEHVAALGAGFEVQVHDVDKARKSLAESRGLVWCTPPSLIASLGMPKTMQLASSWAMLVAPASFISSMPWAPSSPMPVMITPTAFFPA